MNLLSSPFRAVSAKISPKKSNSVSPDSVMDIDGIDGESYSVSRVSRASFIEPQCLQQKYSEKTFSATKIKN